MPVNLRPQPLRCLCSDPFPAFSAQSRSRTHRFLQSLEGLMNQPVKTCCIKMIGQLSVSILRVLTPLFDESWQAVWCHRETYSTNTTLRNVAYITSWGFWINCCYISTAVCPNVGLSYIQLILMWTISSVNHKFLFLGHKSCFGCSNLAQMWIRNCLTKWNDRV